ncbi:hypothetical protein FBD94_11445 [Pedobacter hiemivivus]|uniref:Uncharacterized protein n=1 Tax=Pedobacter hiemivivus TaxID=2530454 RepID=A0A4U1GBW7_9SPHI|nr:hypothetical protein [Pedobacter hiemivivus]TKC61154.1 hypothetical protein FBD94_11445 [Pedobacter hiemivivus]
MKKENYKDLMAAYSLIGLVPPLGILFIVIDWLKGAKVNAASVIGVFLGIILTVVYYLQLTGQM